MKMIITEDLYQNHLRRLLRWLSTFPRRNIITFPFAGPAAVGPAHYRRVSRTLRYLYIYT